MSPNLGALQFVATARFLKTEEPKSRRINGADYPNLDSRNTLKSERIAFAQIRAKGLIPPKVGDCAFTLAICRNKCYSVYGAYAPGALHNGRRLATPPERG